MPLHGSGMFLYRRGCGTERLNCIATSFNTLLPFRARFIVPGLLESFELHRGQRLAFLVEVEAP